MKKVIFAVLFFVFLSFGQNDYLNLNFGMSVEQVRQKGYDIKLLTNDDEILISYADNSRLSPPLVRRVFSFLNNKLMSVVLYYDDVLRAGVQNAIVEGLNNRYKLRGRWKERSDGNGYWAIVDDLEFQVFLQDIDKGEMEVMIRGVKILRQLEEYNRNKTKQNLGF